MPNKNGLQVLSTSRLRPKIVAYFCFMDGTPVSTRQVTRYTNEDVGAIGHLIREYVARKFIKRVDGSYVLAATHIKSELINLWRTKL
jgi:hypothetical protein